MAGKGKLLDDVWLADVEVVRRLNTDTLWGLTYIDEAIWSRHFLVSSGGDSLDKADVIYHLYDAQYSVVARALDNGSAMPKLIERIRYSAYGEPTVFQVHFADIAHPDPANPTQWLPGPDGQLTAEDETAFRYWYGNGEGSNDKGQ